MLTWLVQFSDTHIVFNVFQYLSFRYASAMITSLAICWFAYPSFINWLQRIRAGQTIREDGPQSHLQKAGTPTMGGALIILSIVLSSILWARPEQPLVWCVLVVAVGFGIVGFLDDYQKIARKNTAGLSGKTRLMIEFVIATAVLAYLWNQGLLETSVPIPFFKDTSIELGYAYLAFGAVVIVGAANAVNLTDGLDGLAIGPVMTSMLAMGVLAYIAGNATYTAYLNVPYVHGAGELGIIAVTVVGAGLAFLWFNTFPASIFMGDTGSLPLGGVLGVVAVITRNELLLVLLGGIFVWETLSVIIQVGSYKLTKKRVFKMAPFHHHLELSGWEEPKIIVRFWIISILLALMALLTLKLR